MARNNCKSVSLRGLETGKIIKWSLAGIGIGLLIFGGVKAWKLKNMWDSLVMKFRARIVWKTILTDILDGNITLAVTAYLDNPTSGSVSIRKPAIAIYDGDSLLAYSAENDNEKVSVKANAISEVNYTFTVKANALRKFAGMALTKIIDWWNNLNTENETAAIGVNLNIVAKVSLLGFSKNFQSQVGI